MSDLRRQVNRGDLQFVFVSVDPERDTPEVIARYLAHFDPALLGATGKRADIERFTAALGLAQVRNPGPHATSSTRSPCFKSASRKSSGIQPVVSSLRL
jgi:protein SCO1/2